jgi:activator of HSP90 ATPase
VLLYWQDYRKIPEDNDERTNESNRAGNRGDSTAASQPSGPRLWRYGHGLIENAGESIHQESVINASRKRVYEALTDARQFNEVTKIAVASDPAISLQKAPTVISADVGSAFSLFGGIIVGRQIELAPNTRIVQAWRVSYWDPGAYSIARFELVEQGGGTKIVFDHTGFPKGDAGTLASGWKAHYWVPLAKFLA